MNLHITKSKNSESFYICKSYVKANGCTTSTIVRKLGTLDKLLLEHGPTRDDVISWAKNEVKIETDKYKTNKRLNLSRLRFRLTDNWTMIGKSSSVGDISFCNLFIMGFS